MKKFLAILLAAILLLTSFAVTFAVFADGDEATEPDPVCEYCHQNHTGFFGALLYLIHVIVYFFRLLFGLH